jgi:predicted nucleotidyltransferase
VAQALAPDPIRDRIGSELPALYGPRLKRAVLFGPRARGDARPDPDFDVAVFLDPIEDRCAEIDRLADLEYRFMVERDAFVEFLPYADCAYAKHTPILREIRRDGTEL